jgi:RNA polymerase sigma-B factor
MSTMARPSAGLVGKRCSGGPRGSRPRTPRSPGSEAVGSANGSGLKRGLHNGLGSSVSEAELLRRYAQTRDPALKEELVQRLLPLARSLALRYRATPEPLDDLTQVASLGLVKALDGFDPARATTFAAYAAPTILGELRRHFRDHVWQLRLPRQLQERTMAVHETARRLGDELGRSPTVSQVARCLEISEDEVSEALQADRARHTLSLDVSSNREETQPVPRVETVGGPDAGYEAVEAQLAGECAELDGRERRVLHLRFEEGLPQRQIGSLLGISQMQVSRIMRRALHKLLAAVQTEAARDTLR